MTIPLGRWFNVPVFLHWSWWMFGLFVAVTNPTFVPVFLGMFGIVLLHEFGHCIAAQYYRWNVHHVTLYPIGGAAAMDIMPRPFEEFVVAIAGPLVNVALIPPLIYLSQYHPSLAMLSSVNIAILVFNLLPVFPMDGGRILRSALQGVTKNRVFATHISARIGQVMCVLMAILGIYVSNFILVAIAIFIALAAEQEYQMVKEKQARDSSSSDEEGRKAVQKSADMIDDIERRIARYRKDFDR